MSSCNLIFDSSSSSCSRSSLILLGSSTSGFSGTNELPLLTLEKLQENDRQWTSGVPAPSLDDQAASSTNSMALNIQLKVDDLLSTGSGVSTVEPHLPVEEPFLSASCHKVTLSGAGIHSEDDISDEGCNYHHQRQEMQLDVRWIMWKAFASAKELQQLCCSMKFNVD